MEEDIKILECENVGDLASIGLIDLLNEENGYDLNRLKRQALENLIKRNHYLENEVRKTVNQELDKAKIELYKYYIPKSKVKERIDELREIKYKEEKCEKINNMYYKMIKQYDYEIAQFTIQVLQELIEE